MITATSERGAWRPPLRWATGTLEVVFEWAGDRWRHRVVCGDGVVAESVEGPGPDGDPRWPASPVLQEVSAAVTAARPAVVAVGSAGRSHFSASLSADPSRPDTVLVEVACRIQEPAGWLGSTYRTGSGGVVRVAAGASSAPPCTVTWTYRVGPTGVAPVTGEPASRP